MSTAATGIRHCQSSTPTKPQYRATPVADSKQNKYFKKPLTVDAVFYDAINARPYLPAEQWEMAVGSLKTLATHQSWLSYKCGDSLPKSLKIVCCEIAKTHQLDLNEINLAIILYLLCSGYTYVDLKSEVSKIKEALAADEFTIPELKIPNDPEGHIQNAFTIVGKIFYLYQKNARAQSKKIKSDARLIAKDSVASEIVTLKSHYFADVIAESTRNKGTANSAHYGSYTNSYYSKYSSDVPLFGKEHFRFFFSKTRSVSGLVALSPMGQPHMCWIEKKFVTPQQPTPPFFHIWQTGFVFIDGVAASAFDTSEIKNILEGSKELCKIKDLSQTRKNTIELFQNRKITIEWAIDKSDGTRSNYMCRPVLLYDATTKHYYLNWEFGEKESFAAPKPKYVFHFGGNGYTSDTLATDAEDLEKHTKGIHVLIDYPNKSFNGILNPHLRSFKTSIKGSTNPHMLHYNYLKSKHFGHFDLELFAFSYGNISSAHFIRRLYKYGESREILFIGTGTAASMQKITKAMIDNFLSKKQMPAAAKRILGTIAYWFARGVKLLNKSDLLSMLKKHPKVKAIIFNDALDPIILRSAQLVMTQTHDRIRTYTVTPYYDDTFLSDLEYEITPPAAVSTAQHAPIEGTLLRSQLPLRYSEGTHSPSFAEDLPCVHHVQRDCEPAADTDIIPRPVPFSVSFSRIYDGIKAERFLVAQAPQHPVRT